MKWLPFPINSYKKEVQNVCIRFDLSCIQSHLTTNHARLSFEIKDTWSLSLLMKKKRNISKCE